MGSICQPKLLVSMQGLGGSDLAAGIAEELLATPVGRGAVVAEDKEVVMVGCQDIEVPRPIFMSAPASCQRRKA